MVQKVVSSHDTVSLPLITPIVNKLRVDSFATPIPLRFFQELEDFCMRNLIELEVGRGEDKRNMHKICLQCFKAFMIQQALEFNLSVHTVSHLASKVDAQTGHLNYYLDQGVVKNLDSFL